GAREKRAIAFVRLVDLAGLCEAHDVLDALDELLVRHAGDHTRLAPARLHAAALVRRCRTCLEEGVRLRALSLEQDPRARALGHRIPDARARLRTAPKLHDSGRVPKARPQSPPSREIENASATAGGACRWSSEAWSASASFSTKRRARPSRSEGSRTSASI